MINGQVATVASNRPQGCGGWWYKDCLFANFNGLYYEGGSEARDGIIWGSWNGVSYSVKKCTMKIR